MKLALLWPTLTVRDVDASLAFYSDVLGFGRDFVERDAAGTAFLGSVEVGDTVIRFESPARNVRLEPGHGEQSGVTLTVCFPASADLDGLYSKLQHAAVTICSPIGDRPWGNRDFAIRDPDGYQLVLARPLAGGHGDSRPSNG